jgi:hypothetical protein
MSVHGRTCGATRREPMDGDDQRRVVVTITPTKVIAADLYA